MVTLFELAIICPEVGKEGTEAASSEQSQEVCSRGAGRSRRPRTPWLWLWNHRVLK